MLRRDLRWVFLFWFAGAGGSASAGGGRGWFLARRFFIVECAAKCAVSTLLHSAANVAYATGAKRAEPLYIKGEPRFYGVSANVALYPFANYTTFFRRGTGRRARWTGREGAGRGGWRGAGRRNVSNSSCQWPIGYWKHWRLATLPHWQHSQPFGGIFIADISAFAPQHALTRETDTTALPPLHSSIRPTAFEPTNTSPNAIPSGGTANLGAAKTTEFKSSQSNMTNNFALSS